MIELARAMQSELASACAHLLDEGWAPASVAGGDVAVGPLGHVLRTANAMIRWIPSALDDLEYVATSREEVHEPQRIPRRATPSLRAYHYAVSPEHAGHAGHAGLVPIVWESAWPATEPDAVLLAWLLHAIGRFQEELARQTAMLERAYDEAARLREGSFYGRAELERLAERLAVLRHAEDQLARTRGHVVALGRFRLRPSQRTPNPFPRRRSWIRIRSLLHLLDDPQAALPAIAKSVLLGDVPGVDLPYLYQRWCGWKLVCALRELGFVPRTDPIPVLLLSGIVEFRRDDVAVRLITELRLLGGKPPLHGLQIASGEASPDIVLIAESPRGFGVSILDPTLQTDYVQRQRKSKYVDRIRVNRTRRVAGVSILGGPSRAWAAVPLTGSRCIVDDWRGMHGSVPMHPVEFEARPLRDWLGEVLEEAGGRGV